MANAVTAATLIRAPSTSGGITSLVLYQGWNVFAAEPVASTNTVRSIVSISSPTVLGFNVLEYRFFGLWVQLAGSTPDVKVNLLESWDDVEADYVQPDTNGLIKEITDTSVHIYALLPSPMPFIRIEAIGQGSNGSNVTITAKLILQG